MSVQRIETAVNIQDRALIDKNKALKLSRIFDGYKGNIEFNADSQFAYFSGRGITVICSQLSGKFPDWKSGMGQIKNFNRFEIAASEFCKIEPLKNGITPAEPGIVFHKIERLGAIAAAAPAEPENVVLIGADAPDFPNMKLNYNYAADFIKNLSSDWFIVEYKTGKDGVLFTAGNWKYLLMPMNTIYIPEEHTRCVEYLKKEVKTARAEETRAKNKHFKKGDLETSNIYVTATKRRERAEKELEATEKMFEASREKWGKFFENIENIAWNKNGIGTTQEKPLESLETSAAADAVTNTTPAAKAPETQADATETAKEETTEKPEQEKRVKIAALESSAPLATVPEPENRSAAADQNGHAAAEPEPVETAPADAEKRGWKIGTYTTKKGKIKTSIRFFQPPTSAQIEALKKAFYWEYNGTWNGSPRKLPEIFKH